MECPHKNDIEEIKKDVKLLLAYMHEQKGRSDATNSLIIKISGIISFIVSTIIAIIGITIKGE